MGGRLKHMPKRKVGAGETTSSLALKNGFFWKTIWEHGENAELRNFRPDPNVLLETDEIFIPERVEKTGVMKGTESEHVFKRKGEPSKVKIKFMELGQPRAGKDYVIKIGTKLIEGTTNGDGLLEHFIPGDTRFMEVEFKDGSLKQAFNVGGLDPADVISGVDQRLNNLGFKTGGIKVPKGMSAEEAIESGKAGKKFTDAIKKFQADNEIELTGKLDSKTKSLLKKIK